jgi:GcrA cell cycle regulator
MPKDVPWSDNDVRTLTDMWLTHTASQIARELNRTRSSVCGKAGRLRSKGTQLAPMNGKLYVTPPPNARRPAPLAPLARPIKRVRLRHRTIPMPKPPPFVDDRLVMDPCILIELDNKRCHWPLGEFAEKATLFCGGVAIHGTPYCAHHYKRAFKGGGDGDDQRAGAT